MQEPENSSMAISNHYFGGLSEKRKWMVKESVNWGFKEGRRPYSVTSPYDAQIWNA